MRTAAPPLLPIFRSKYQADLLTWLYLHPAEEFSLSEIARRVEVAQSTLHGEVQRLVDAGLVAQRRVGRSRMLRACPQGRLGAPLSLLLVRSFGPHVVVGEEFADVHEAELVVVYGSWAARYRGEPGPAPADIDVMVVGNVRRDEIYAAADRVQTRVGLAVNTTVRSRRAWEEGSDALVAEVRSQPFVTSVDRGAGHEPVG